MTIRLLREGTPPVAPRRTDHALFRHELHGTVLEDPLSWLRDRDDPAVLEHLEAENDYTEAVLAQTEALQEELYQEMVARIEEDDVSVPVRLGGYWYYERRHAGRQHEVHCRQAARPGVPPDESYDAEAPEEVLLDLDEMREEDGLPFLELGAFRPSPCGRLLAYSVDPAGHERYEVRILDLTTGEHLPERLEQVARSLAWGNQSRVLYYVTRDEAQRPYRAWRHRLGSDPADDEVLWEEDDERFFLGLRRSRSGRFVFLEAGSHTTSEVRVLDADDPESRVQPLTGRRHRVEYQIDHVKGRSDDEGVGGSRFFLLSNLDAPEFRLLEVSDQDPAPENWRDVVAHDPEIHLDSIYAFDDYLVLRRRVEGLPTIRVFDLAGGTHHDIEFDEPAHDIRVGAQPESDTRLLRLIYQSPVTPPTVLDYDMESRRRDVRKVEAVHGYDADLYVTRRYLATAKDGVEVPVDVVERRDRDVPGPLLLYGYGAYGHSLEARFHRNIVNLLDRGWAFAVAHVRGGSEMGQHWHEAGRVEHKENSFHDFIAAAERLIGEGLTTSDQLAIRGGSAGGMLMGAVLNLRPDLFRAAIADVPFVDVLYTMLDPSLPLTVIEFEEWGNPAADLEAFARLRGYAPYLNVRNVPYPHILATAGLHDPRVQYWEPAKWVQMLREKQEQGDDSGGVVLLKTEMEAGHGGASGRYEVLRQEATRQAFLLAAMES